MRSYRFSSKAAFPNFREHRDVRVLRLTIMPLIAMLCSYAVVWGLDTHLLLGFASAAVLGAAFAGATYAGSPDRRAPLVMFAAAIIAVVLAAGAFAVFYEPG